MEKCNFLKILQCPDFENLWGDFWHLFQPKKLDESDGGFFFLRIIFSSHVTGDKGGFHDDENYHDDDDDDNGDKSLKEIDTLEDQQADNPNWSE